MSSTPSDSSSASGPNASPAWPAGLHTSFLFPHEPKQRPKPAAGLEPGQVVGDFRLVEMIGQGGMGQVWEAEQLSLGGRKAAVKFVRPERVSELQLEFFRREARAGGRLSHPGIVAIYGYGEEDGLAWIGMELVPGDWTLADAIDHMAGAEELPAGYFEHVARLVAAVADAMQAAHDAGVIHRDLKPQNILITPDDRPKVTDFGLARIADEGAISNTGEFAGSYYYMSPEQVAAKRAGLDHRTDVFSLGATLYELLTLKRPFDGDTAHEIGRQILFDKPTPPRELSPEIPEALAAACLRALEKQPDERFQTMGEFAGALRDGGASGGAQVGDEEELGVGSGRVRSAPGERAGGGRPRAGAAEASRGRTRLRRRVLWAALVGLLAVGALWQWTVARRAAQLDWGRIGASLMEKGPPGPGVDPAIMSQPNYVQRVAFAKQQVALYEERRAQEAPVVAAPQETALEELVISSVHIPETDSLRAAIDAVPELAWFSPRVYPAAEEAAFDEGAEFGLDLAAPIRAVDLLELLAERGGEQLGWGWSNEESAFRTEEALRGALQLKSFPVWDLVSGDPLGTEGAPFDGYDLPGLVTEDVAFGQWEHDGVSIELYSGVLIVNHVSSVLTDVEGYLSSLRLAFLHPGASPSLRVGDGEAAYRRAATALRSRLAGAQVLHPAGDFEVVDLDWVVGEVSASAGLDVLVGSAIIDEIDPGDLRAFFDPQWGTVLELLDGYALQAESVAWELRHGVLLFTTIERTSRHAETRIYPVWDLIESLEGTGSSRPVDVLGDDTLSVKNPDDDREALVITSDTLDALIRDNFAAESWELNPANSVRITEGGVLIVSQSPEVHRAIAHFLEDLRRGSVDLEGE